jgi:RNA polymerase-binding transcription factor DksA
MTKKTKASNTQSTQASDEESVPKIKRPRGRPRKDATLSGVSPPKGKQERRGVKKSAVSKSEKTSPVRRGRKPKVAVAVDSEVEIKVREIVKKTRSKTPKAEEKKESSTFNLDDVRAIIQKRKAVAVSSKPKKKKKVKEKEEKLVPSNEEPKKTGKSVKVKKLQTASIDDILGFGVSVGPTRPIRDAKKVPKEWKVYYIDLMNLRHSLKGALGQRSNETLGASARESSGELSINSADSGSESFNRDVALSMVATEQEALEEIEDAIDRIFDGTFGICQETEKPIKKSRLKVVPFTRFSLEGQTLYEKRNRKERDTGGGIFATISDSTLGDDS